MTAVPPDVGELRRLEAVAVPAPWAVADGRSIVLRWPNHVAPLFQWANDPLEGAIGVRSVATTEFIVALRNSASWLLGQAEAAQRVRAIHQPRTTTVYSGAHHDADHDSEDERCTDACFEPWTLCNGDGSAWPCETIRALDGRSE